MHHQLFRHLDHSLLAPTVTVAELEQGALDAMRLGCAALCIVPFFVPRAAALLRGSSVRTCTVIAFPHGVVPLAAKLREAELALGAGALELDVVVNLGLVKSGTWPETERELSEVTRLTHSGGGQVKWILETAACETAEIVRLCQLCTQAGADWVKTSTGFGPGGATPESVALLRASCPPEVQVKASGGIRSWAEVERYVSLGASRVGTSRTVQLAAELVT